jgi:Calx-beta domain
VRRLLFAAVLIGTTIATIGAGSGPASAATSITAPTANPFTVPGDAGGLPLPFTVSASGFAASTNVFIEQCDGVSPTAVGWDPTTNCDLGSSPAPVVSDGSGNVSFLESDANHAFHPFKGASPQGLFNCLSPNDPSPNNGLPDYRNCQFRVSTNNTASTSDQLMRTIFLPDDPNTPPPPPLKVNIGDAGVPEGNSSSRVLTFTAALSRTSLTPVTVHYATESGTAKSGSDFVAKSGDLHFAAGDNAVSVTVKVNGDTKVEPDELFYVRLSNPVGATIGRARGAGTVINDDPPHAGVRVGIGNASEMEGNSGKRGLVLTVSLSQVATKNVTVSYTTIAGTATAGTDFVPKSGTATIAAGKTAALIAIPIKGDTTVEPTETFKVKISNAVHAAIDRPTGTGKITNDD